MSDETDLKELSVKLKLDLLKHITTLSVSAIVAVATFREAATGLPLALIVLSLAGLSACCILAPISLFAIGFNRDRLDTPVKGGLFIRTNTIEEASDKYSLYALFCFISGVFLLAVSFLLTSPSAG